MQLRGTPFRVTRSVVPGLSAGCRRPAVIRRDRVAEREYRWLDHHPRELSLAWPRTRGTDGCRDVETCGKGCLIRARWPLTQPFPLPFERRAESCTGGSTRCEYGTYPRPHRVGGSAVGPDSPPSHSAGPYNAILDSDPPSRVAVAFLGAGGGPRMVMPSATGRSAPHATHDSDSSYIVDGWTTSLFAR